MKLFSSIVNTNADQIEFGIEILGSVETYGFTYLHFEAQHIHDRKLWMQKLNEAIKNYKDKADLDKSKKESGKNYRTVKSRDFRNKSTSKISRDFWGNYNTTVQQCRAQVFTMF